MYMRTFRASGCARLWVTHCMHFLVKGVMKADQAEHERLKKENAKLRMERDLLKKAAAYFAKESM